MYPLTDIMGRSAFCGVGTCRCGIPFHPLVLVFQGKSGPPLPHWKLKFVVVLSVVVGHAY